MTRERTKQTLIIGALLVLMGVWGLLVYQLPTNLRLTYGFGSVALGLISLFAGIREVPHQEFRFTLLMIIATVLLVLGAGFISSSLSSS